MMDSVITVKPRSVSILSVCQVITPQAMEGYL